MDQGLGSPGNFSTSGHQLLLCTREMMLLTQLAPGASWQGSSLSVPSLSPLPFTTLGCSLACCCCRGSWEPDQRRPRGQRKRLYRAARQPCLAGKWRVVHGHLTKLLHRCDRSLFLYHYICPMMVGWHHQFNNGHELGKLRETVRDRECLVCYSPWLQRAGHD